jgi:hypothetical protein
MNSECVSFTLEREEEWDSLLLFLFALLLFVAAKKFIKNNIYFIYLINFKNKINLIQFFSFLKKKKIKYIKLNFLYFYY